MSLTNMDRIFEVNESEYGYSAGAFRPTASGRSIPLYIPKLMGAITSIGPESIIINGLFANAKECKPLFATKVNRSKSISVIVKENCNWLDKVNSSGIVPSGSMFNVEFLNGNISTPYATTK